MLNHPPNCECYGCTKERTPDERPADTSTPRHADKPGAPPWTHLRTDDGRVPIGIMLGTDGDAAVVGLPGNTGRAGVKADDSKPRWSLIPWGSMRAVLEVIEYGARKYAPDGWQTVPNGGRRYLDAALRHMLAMMAGEDTDPESGLPHAAHAVASLLFVLWFDRDED